MNILKIYVLGGLKNSKNLNIFCTFHVKRLKLHPSSNLKDKFHKQYIDMSNMYLHVNLHIFYL